MRACPTFARRESRSRSTRRERLTRKALEVSQLTAFDAIRARLDSEAPKVTLTMEVPEWEPLAWTPHGMPCNLWP